MSVKDNIFIRLSDEVDLDDILEIEPLSFGAHHWSRDAFESEFSSIHTCYLSAILSVNSIKKCVGYVGSWIIEDEGHITTMAVHPNYRSLGIADKLLYNLISTLINKSVKWLTLEVRSSNTPALNLYKKYGFKQIGIRKKYYQDNGEDGLILWTNNITDHTYKDLLNNIADKLQYKK